MTTLDNSAPVGPHGRPLIFYEIPKESPAVPCQWCGQSIFFGVTKRGHRIPLSVDLAGCSMPTMTEPGYGQPHFADCTGLAAARQPRRPA